MVWPNQRDTFHNRQSAIDSSDCNSYHFHQTEVNAGSPEKKASLLIESSNRQNVSYAVKVIIPNPAKTFHAMRKEPKELKDNYTRTIIYCQTK